MDTKKSLPKDILYKMRDDILSGKIRFKKVNKLNIDNYRYLKHIQEIADEKLNQEDREIYIEVLINGSTCLGKSIKVLDENGWDEVFIVVENDNNFRFDGYKGEKVLLIEDFNGWIKYKTLLKYLDKYPLKLHTKGGSTWAAWTKIFITSNDNIEKWYKRDITRLKMKINKIRELEDD